MNTSCTDYAQHRRDCTVYSIKQYENAIRLFVAIIIAIWNTFQLPATSSV